MKVRIAEMRDVLTIQDLIYPDYFKDSIYKNLKYDRAATTGFITEWVNNYCFVAENNDGKIIGVTAFYFVNTYYKEKECDILMFYVEPDYRGTGISRALVDAVVKTCKLRGDVGAIYTSSGSGIKGKNNNLYSNLFKKFGFKELGTELVNILDE